VAWFLALLASMLVTTLTAVPAAATKAVNITAVPVAVSHPKKARPTLTPPYSSFSRWKAPRPLRAESSGIDTLPRLERLSSGRGLFSVSLPVASGLMSCSLPGAEVERCRWSLA